MDPHGWVALGTLIVAVTLFISKRIPLEVTALSIPVVLAITRTLPTKDCLAGFGNEAVIALGGIFILGAGLQEAGVATIVARGLERLGGRGPTRAIFVIMVAVAILSAFMSNAAAVAVFLPAVAVLARRTGIAPSRLMMPLAYSAILGGTLTLIGTTPNLILGNELLLRTGTGLGMFDFAPVGIAVTAVGIAFMALVGWRMLPSVDPRAQLGGAAPNDLAQQYGLGKHLYCMKVVAASTVVGRTIAEVGLRKQFGLDVVLVMRSTGMRQVALDPDPRLAFEVGDLIYVEGEAEKGWRFAEEETLQFGLVEPDAVEEILGRGVSLAEVTLAPRSDAAGKTLEELAFREKHGLNVVAVWRASEVINAAPANLQLQMGDAFLLAGPSDKLRELAHDPDYVVIGNGLDTEDVRRAPLAVLLLLVAIVPPLVGLLPLAISALASAVLMIFTRCASVDGARRSFDVTILSLLVGTIPLGIALDRTGVAAHLAEGILNLRTIVGDQGLLGCLFVVSAVLSTTSNNGAAAVILAPVAARVADLSSFSVTAAFLAVAYGASCAFILPFAHQCNLMVMSPGGYATRDFVRVGIPMSILMALTTALLLSAV
ncbi:MAG: SLC13 family permease [Planctomycetota bacterium]